MAKKTIIIIDKDIQYTKDISRHLSVCEELSIIGTAETGDIGLEIVKTHFPDIVIMGLLLDNIDGLSLIGQLTKLSFSPSIIVCSSLSNETFIKQAISQGATCYFTKPICLEELQQKVLSVAAGESAQEYVVKRFTSKEIEEKLSNIFMTAGIPVHVKGFRFLKEAVKQSVEHPSMINNITKILYPAIAKKYESTPSKVERAIRHAIGVAWSKGKIENINKIFGVQLYGREDKPTNGELIALVADKIMIDCS